MAINNTNIDEAVRVYLRRAKREKLPRYPLAEKGLYKIMGGSGERSREEIQQPFVVGRFVDAIAYAIQQSEFGGWWCSLDKPEDVDNCNHGYVVKIEPHALPKNKSLDSLLK